MLLFIFAFFNAICLKLRTFVFSHAIICDNKANFSINYFFIPVFIFLIFDQEYLFTYYILLIQRTNFTIFNLKNFPQILIFLFSNAILSIYLHL